MDYIPRAAVNLLPVLFFLLALNLLDSYKLLKLRTLVFLIGIGCACAVASLPLNSLLIRLTDTSLRTFARIGAPLTEETLKSICIIYLIKTRKLGFIVDSAIAGFAVGAGFAIFENAYNLSALEESSVLTWIVRGLGTAIMHGGTTAVFGIISKDFFDRSNQKNYAVFLPGLLAAALLHSFYNHFLLSPLLSTIIIHVTLPFVVIAAFYQSERATRQWLGKQFDTDAELLDIINSGQVSDSRIGVLFRSIGEKFPPEVVVDMLCYLRVHVELAISAKGLLLMREAGFNPEPAPEVRAKFDELRYLEKVIGKTGRLAVLPFIHKSARDLWQLHLLD